MKYEIIYFMTQKIIFHFSFAAERRRAPSRTYGATVRVREG
jgi:hypothetical protein